MRPVVVGVSAVLAFALGAALLGGIYIYLGSEAVIQRRYPLPSTVVTPLQTAETLALGRHVARTLGCLDCHGEDLRGRTVNPLPFFSITAPNLRRSEDDLSDKDIARAVRYGLRGNGTSLWGMPSASYVYMRDADMDALIAYVRSLPVSPDAAPAPEFGLGSRRAILQEDIAPAAAEALLTDGSLDLGPRTGGGRYIARTTCAECHGLDLGGSADGRVPSLDGMLHYSLHDFFSLIRGGGVPKHRPYPEMSRLSRARFNGFADYEIVALYQYLYARAVSLPVADTPR